jgi:hypothetical protein
VKPALELTAREPRALHDLSVLVGTGELEDALGKINGNGSSIHIQAPRWN